MNDIADDAHFTEELHRESALNEIRKRAKTKYTGFCLTCNDISKPNSQFCSKDCQEDQELIIRIGRIKGNSCAFLK